MSENDIAVVYIARGSEDGLESARRFVESYRVRPAGHDHALTVVTKGWQSESQLDELRQVFKHVSCDMLPLPDDGFDLGAYFRAAKQLGSTWIVCLNTHSVLLADNWLGKLFACAKLPEVGAAGATGSWASHFTIHQRFPKPRRAFGSMRRFADLCWYRYYFHRFPNAHLRTNAFMIRRSLLLKFAARVGVPSTKEKAYVVESGRSGLTAFLRGEGLQVMVCGADGEVFRANDWPSSQTFSVGRQTNLLVADNQTRLYEYADHRHRGGMQLTAWGSIDSTVL